MRKIIFWILVGFVSKPAGAQQPATTHWITLQMPVVLNKHWQWLNEISYRTLGESFSLNQLFLRTGARYTFNEKWNVAGSSDLVFIRVYPQNAEKDFGKEYRLWQEVNFMQPIKNNFLLQNRLRIEEKYFTETKRMPAYHALRLRYRLALIKKISEKWSVQMYEEYMQQLTGNEFRFSQNRVYIGGACQFQPDLLLQFSYCWSKLSPWSQHIFAIVFQKRISANAKRRKQNG